MTVADKIISFVSPKNKPARPTNSAAPIAEKLAKAEQYLAELETQYGKHSLASIEDGEVGELSLKNFLQDVDTAKAQVSMLRAAHAAAVERDRQGDTAKLASIRGSQINAVRAHLQQRDKAAARATAAIENLANAWFEMLREADAAIAASPVALPSWAKVHARQLADAITTEYFRAGHGPESRNGIHPSLLPGGKFLTHLAPQTGNRRFLAGKMDDPDIWPSLLTLCTEETAQLIAMLKGEPMPMPAAPAKPKENLKIPAEMLADPQSQEPAPPAAASEAEPERVITDIELNAALFGAKYQKPASAVDALVAEFGGGKNVREVPASQRLELFKRLEALPNREVKN